MNKQNYQILSIVVLSVLAIILIVSILKKISQKISKCSIFRYGLPEIWIPRS